MKNRILTIFRGNIPYIKELRQLTGSVTASILMQQLDYWFEKKPNGFYKFLEPCKNENQRAYTIGESWTEELGFSKAEFRSAFEKIGIVYKSKNAFLEAKDKGELFKDKFYCSFTDRIKNLTFYYRNHELLDKKLDELVINKGVELKTDIEIPEIDSCKSTKLTHVSKESSFTDVKKVDSDITEDYIQKTTTEEYILSKDNISEIIQQWNSIGIQQITKITSTSKRGQMLKTRIKEYSFDKVIEAIENIKDSDFLKGQNDRSWIIDFEWFVKPNNFHKVLENRYKNRKKKTADNKNYNLISAEELEGL